MFTLKIENDTARVNGVEQTLERKSVIRTTDGAVIPFDEANTDYQEYLKWVAEGSLPSPADIVEPSQASVTPLPADE
jgi:hypothetical protein